MVPTPCIPTASDTGSATGFQQVQAALESQSDTFPFRVCRHGPYKQTTKADEHGDPHPDGTNCSAVELQKYAGSHMVEVRYAHARVLSPLSERAFVSCVRRY